MPLKAESSSFPLVLIERLKGWLGLAAFGAVLALAAAIVLGPGFIAWRSTAPR